MFMAVPKPDPDIATMVAKINAVHGSQTDTLPLLYKWFPTIEGLRFYHNGPQVFLSNINIKAQGLLTHTKAGIEAVKIAAYPNPAVIGNPIFATVQHQTRLTEIDKLFKT
jgi:hypothetical protein